MFVVVWFLFSQNSLCQLGKCGKCSSNLPVHLKVQREVVSDGRAKVGEFIDCLQLKVVDGDSGVVLNTLAQFVDFLQTNNQTEFFVHEVLHLLLRVSYQCCIVGKQHFP